MSASERGSFSSSFGVIVAMAGSAVGLGNMWRFPYLVGENGGAAFILIYLLFVLVFCLPVRRSQRRQIVRPPGAEIRLAAGRRAGHSGRHLHHGFLSGDRRMGCELPG